MLCLIPAEVYFICGILKKLIYGQALQMTIRGNVKRELAS